MSRGYLYNIGDNVNGVVITKQLMVEYGSQGRRAKGYEYECPIDKYVGTKTETNFLKGTGCLYCSGQVVVRGVNDIATTHPDLAQYFKNTYDTYTHSFSSNKSCDIVCPRCNTVKSMKINDLYRQGIGCRKCSDGISYPEKVMFNVLTQLGVSFITQLSSKHTPWCLSYKYDFYIKDIDAIIEVHGMQHYDDARENNVFDSNNDLIKEELALQNVSKYIVIDCRYSDIDWIKNNITEAMSDVYNLSDVNWQDCSKYASNSMISLVCDMYNNGTHDPKLIASSLKLDYTTVLKYLHKGTKLLMCNYDSFKSSAILKNEKLGKRVRVIETNKTYLSCADLARNSEKDYGVKMNANTISEVCNGIHKTHRGYHLEYV